MHTFHHPVSLKPFTRVDVRPRVEHPITMHIEDALPPNNGIATKRELGESLTLAGLSDTPTPGPINTANNRFQRPRPDGDVADCRTHTQRNHCAVGCVTDDAKPVRVQHQTTMRWSHKVTHCHCHASARAGSNRSEPSRRAERRCRL